MVLSNAANPNKYSIRYVQIFADRGNIVSQDVSAAAPDYLMKRSCAVAFVGENKLERPKKTRRKLPCLCVLFVCVDKMCYEHTPPIYNSVSAEEKQMDRQA